MTAPAQPLPRIRPQPAFAGILRDTEQFGTGESRGAGERLNSWFDTLMVQSGMNVAPAVVLMLCLCSGVALGGVVFVVQENFLTAALGALIGFLIPVVVAMGLRARRQKTMMEQLPPMIEELARAARTGRSIDQCLDLVAADTPSPLGDELRLVTKRLHLGVPLRDAVSDLPYRTGLMTMNLLCMSLSVHQQTGGDLVTVLERLSRTIRDRLQFLGRLKASTAASRATAVLMLLVPPAVLLFFTFRDANYFQTLMSSTWGRNATIIAFALEIIGAVWVMRILRDSQKT